MRGTTGAGVESVSFACFAARLTAHGRKATPRTGGARAVVAPSQVRRAADRRVRVSAFCHCRLIFTQSFNMMMDRLLT